MIMGLMGRVFSFFVSLQVRIKVFDSVREVHSFYDYGCVCGSDMVGVRVVD